MYLKAFSDYLQFEKQVSSHTITAYLKDMDDFRVYIRDEFDMGVEDLSYAMIRNWIVFLTESGISARSINRKISSLRSYYRFLMKIGRLEKSPLAQHNALKAAKKVQIPFSKKEVNAVMDLLESEEEDFGSVRNRLIMELLYSTGMRRSELIGLEVKDLGFSNRSIRIRGKGNKERIVPLLPSVVSRAEEYLRYRGRLPEIVDEDFLLLTEKGKALYPNLVYRLVHGYFDLVSEKVKKSPHLLRHSFATHLINEGANINAVKELLGHSGLASTQVYAENNIARLKEVYENSHPRSR